MASQKALDSKHEKILKDLSRKSDNKRCANCDTTGPSYVVTNFNTFVCTVCGGIHRQFGHRVKGITMATFKPEEIQALQDGGNEKCLQLYLAKWTPRDLAKPTDRIPHKIKDWIEAVYVKKRYYSPEGAKVESANPPVATAEPMKKQDGAVRVVSRAGSLASGGGSFSVPVSPPLVTEPQSATAVAFDPFADPTPTSTTSASWADFSAPVAKATDTGGAAVSQQPATDFFSTNPGTNVPSATPVQQPAWDAFGSGPAAPPSAVPPTATAVTTGSPAPTTTGWTSFDDKPAAAQPAQSGSQAGWQAFGDASNPSATQVTEEPKKPPVRELPLELFSEVASLGLAPQPGRGPPQGMNRSYGPPAVQPAPGFGYGAQSTFNQGYAQAGAFNASGSFAPTNNSLGYQGAGFQQNQSSNFNSSYNSTPSATNFGMQQSNFNANSSYNNYSGQQPAGFNANFGTSYNGPPTNGSYTSNNFSGSQVGNGGFSHTFSNGPQTAATNFGQNMSGGFSSVSSPVATSVDAFGNVTNVNSSYTSHKSEPAPDAFSELVPGFKQGASVRSSLPSSFTSFSTSQPVAPLQNFGTGQPASSVPGFGSSQPAQNFGTTFAAQPVQTASFPTDFGATVGGSQGAPKSGNPFA